MNTRRIRINNTNTATVYVCYDNETHKVTVSTDDSVKDDWSITSLDSTLIQTGRPCFTAVALYKQGIWLRLFMKATGAPELARMLHELQKNPDVLYDMSTIRFTNDKAYIYCNRIIIDPTYVLQKRWLQDTTGLQQYSYFKTGRLTDKPKHGAIKRYIKQYSNNSGIST